MLDIARRIVHREIEESATNLSDNWSQMTNLTATISLDLHLIDEEEEVEEEKNEKKIYFLSLSLSFQGRKTRRHTTSM